MTQKKANKKYTYIKRTDIKEMKALIHGKVLNVDPKTILSGAYVSTKIKPTTKKLAVAKNDPDKLRLKILNYAKGIYAEDDEKLEPEFSELVKSSDLKTFIEYGLSEEMIMAFYCGMKSVVSISSDNELSELGDSIFILRTDGNYITNTISSALENAKNGVYELAFKYPEFDWKKAGFKLSKTETIDGKEYDFVPKKRKNKIKLETYKLKPNFIVVATKYIGYTEDGVFKSSMNDTIEGKLELNGGYLNLISKNAKELFALAKKLFKQDDAYFKDVNWLTQGLGGGSPKELDMNNVKFAKGGEIIEINEDGSNLPEPLYDLFGELDEDEDSYVEMERLRLKAKEIGYDFDYDLSGQPTDFWKTSSYAEGGWMLGKENREEIGDLYDELEDTTKTISKTKSLMRELYQKGNSYAKGGSLENEVYIDFMNKDKNFIIDRKYFKTYEEAEKWARKEFEKFHPDMINYTYAKGGSTKSVIYKHKHIPTMTFEVTVETKNGYKGIQRDKKSLSKIERTRGKKVSYSTADLNDLFSKEYAKGGSMAEGGDIEEIGEGEMVFVTSENDLIAEVTNMGSKQATVVFLNERPSGGDKRGTYAISDLVYAHYNWDNDTYTKEFSKGGSMAEGGSVKRVKNNDERGKSYAKGGMVEHGLRIGDIILKKGIRTIVVENSATTSFSKKYVVNLQNGTREDYDTYSKGGSMAEGGNIGVAQEIVSQLGGTGRLKAMTGAYNFGTSGNNLTFRIKNRKVNYVRIALNGKDLYDLQFGRVSGAKFTIIKEYNDIYNDQLVELFEETTGMYLTFKQGGGIEKANAGMYVALAGQAKSLAPNSFNSLDKRIAKKLDKDTLWERLQKTGYENQELPEKDSLTKEQNEKLLKLAKKHGFI